VDFLGGMSPRRTAFKLAIACLMRLVFSGSCRHARTTARTACTISGSDTGSSGCCAAVHVESNKAIVSMEHAALPLTVSRETSVDATMPTGLLVGCVRSATASRKSRMARPTTFMALTEPAPITSELAQGRASRRGCRIWQTRGLSAHRRGILAYHAPGRSQPTPPHHQEANAHAGNQNPPASVGRPMRHGVRRPRFASRGITKMSA
jgi:hypothetical protein